MCFTKKQQKVIGRWFEGLGLGIVAGGLVTFSIVQYKYWYFLIAGAIIAALGAYLYENV